jgi:glucose/arabinose dehydrogenase
MHASIPLLATALALGAATLPQSAGYGPAPTLPEPDPQKIPTVKIAPARPWEGADKPQAAAGFAVNAFAVDLAHPRMLYVLPNGDVLVAETDTPEKPEDYKGIKGAVMKNVQHRAGSGHGSANRLTLLRDADGDGVAELHTVFLEGLNSPYGMALVGNMLYVANTDSLVRVPYHEGETQIATTPVKGVDLPGGPINHHWTKNLVASRDGKRLYVSVGSNSNAGENGIDKEANRAGVLEVDPATGKTRVFASGLRNPVGMGWQPDSGALWVAVNERDELGDDLVPDYMTALKDGAFYGFPYSYYGDHLDPRVKEQRPDLVAKASVPDYALGAHTASLGLAFYDGKAFPERYRGGAFIGQHGSWNRSQPSGYKVIFVRFENGRPVGEPEDILTGFVDGKGDAHGRPVGVAVDRRGALLVADDVGGRVWRVTAAQ